MFSSLLGLAVRRILPWRVYNRFDFVKSPEYICGEIFLENLSLGNDVVKDHDKLIQSSPERFDLPSLCIHHLFKNVFRHII